MASDPRNLETPKLRNSNPAMAQAELLADDYKVNLDVFEGPLDLLLYLIRREELDI